ncbi:MAG: ornithine acetyltransferase [Caldiserica bacterium]|nr:MAG: ornithine acetyltransferase [Caldisericota bacterium]
MKKVKGFLFSGVHAGLKRKRKDVGLIYSLSEASSFAVFTKNKFKGAHIPVSKEHLKSGTSRAIIVNSANANTLNGEKGIKDAMRMTEITAKLLKLNKEDVLVASTGVIGVPLPMKKIEKGIKLAVSSLTKNGTSDFEEAIMTTDKVKKEASTYFRYKGNEIRILGMAKGSGMIEPNMATMLAFIVTDARIELDVLRRMLKFCVNRTFNRISVDGCMSTNDSVFIMANGRSGSPRIDRGKSFYMFRDALLEICKDLSFQIVKDGEGATKVIRIIVKNAESESFGKDVARRVANSNLVKTAIYGEDPNFGRIIAAIGTLSDKVREDIDVSVGEVIIIKNGRVVEFDRKRAKEKLKKDTVEIIIDLKDGNKEVEFLTSDLTEEYVVINSRYTT